MTKQINTYILGILEEKKTLQKKARKEFIENYYYYYYYYDQAMTLKELVQNKKTKEGYVFSYPNGFKEEYFTEGNLKDALVSYTDSTSNAFKNNNKLRYRN
jgi:hypothetical protein